MKCVEVLVHKYIRKRCNKAFSELGNVVIFKENNSTVTANSGIQELRLRG